jgi:hypothetical protein
VSLTHKRNSYKLRSRKKGLHINCGTETSVAQQNIQANPTILSGDIGTAGDASDNCYHGFNHWDWLGLDENSYPVKSMPWLPLLLE